MMMQFRGFLFLLLSNWIYISEGALPACSENSPRFNKCIEDALNSIIPSLKHGWTHNELPGLDPVNLPSVNTSFTKDAMDISLSTWNTVIKGLANSRVYAVKTKNLYMGKLEIVLKVPILEATGEYDTEGELATFPLSSRGRFNITMDDVTVVFIVYMERYNLGKEGRLAVKSLSLDLVPGQIHMIPADTLDGDYRLGKTLEVYLNENSYELYNMVKLPLMKYFSDLARIMINSYMSQVPDYHLIVA